MALVAAVACAGGAEHAVVGEFFAASRLRDLTALDRLATVRFEPREQGTVLDFSVVDVQQQTNDAEMVTVDAQMHLPDGTRAQKRIYMTLGRRDSRWIVTGVTVSQGSRATPPR